MQPNGAKAFLAKAFFRQRRLFRLSRLPISPPSSVTVHTTPESESDEKAEPSHEADAGRHGDQNGHSADGDHGEDNHSAANGPLPSLPQ
ncbi:TPA: hypothetical protein ACH3X2_010546 [Trebouxia sp. C0005]